MHDWLFGYMGPENSRPLSSCIYKTLEQDTILEANRVMLTQKIEVEVHSDQ
jgi:hypothetical protein